MHAQAQWAEGVVKNHDIDSACRDLEGQIKAARDRQAAALAEQAAAEQVSAETGFAPPVSVTASSAETAADDVEDPLLEPHPADDAMPDAEPDEPLAATAAAAPAADMSAE